MENARPGLPKEAFAAGPLSLMGLGMGAMGAYGLISALRNYLSAMGQARRGNLRQAAKDAMWGTVEAGINLPWTAGMVRPLGAAAKMVAGMSKAKQGTKLAEWAAAEKAKDEALGMGLPFLKPNVVSRGVAKVNVLPHEILTAATGKNKAMASGLERFGNWLDPVKGVRSLPSSVADYFGPYNKFTSEFMGGVPGMAAWLGAPMLTESLIGLPSYMQEKYAMEKQAAKTGGVVEWVKNLLRKTRDTRITSPSPSTDKARLEWSSLPAAIPYMSLGGVAGGIAADDDSKAEGALLGALGGLPGGLVAHYGGRELARDGRLSHAMVQALAATLSGGGGAALGGTGDLKERAKQALIGAGMGLGVRGGREAAIELGARVPAGIGGMTSLLTTPPLGVAGGIAGQELARKIVGEKDKLPPPPVDSGIMLPPPVPRLALT